MFGAGKPQTGCLVLPSDLAKDLSREEIMEKVWPVIEQANLDAPTHSRLLPEMVEILPYVYFLSSMHDTKLSKSWHDHSCGHQNEHPPPRLLRKVQGSHRLVVHPVPISYLIVDYREHLQEVRPRRYSRREESAYWTGVGRLSFQRNLKSTWPQPLFEARQAG